MMVFPREYIYLVSVAKSFSKTLHQATEHACALPTNGVWHSSSSTDIPAPNNVSHFYHSHLSECVSHCDFNLHFPRNEGCGTLFKCLSVVWICSSMAENNKFLKDV